MKEFIRGWKRKVGVLTLGLACVAMAGWVRSMMICDSIQFPAVMHKTDSMATIDTLASTKSSIAWEQVHEESYEGGIDLGSPYPQWQTSSSGRAFPDWDDSELKMRWRWRWCGFCFGESPYEDGAWLTLLVIPYWSITITLTVLSACLLLSKPRKSTQIRTAAPIGKEGGGAAS